MIKHSIKIGLLIALAILAIGSITMLLWNGLVPTLFNGPTISFAQALGLLLLSKILFGGWKKGWNHGGSCHSGKHQYWRKKMEQRMADMSPEEKEKFKAKFAYCGYTEIKEAE